MAKNTFATLGILAVLLLSLVLTSAAAENGFEIEVVGAGSATDNRISGNPGEVVTFSVQFNNSNSTYPDINLSLSGIDITPQELSITGDQLLTVSFTIPATQVTDSRTLNGIVNSSGITVAEISDPVYYTVTSAAILGCTDPTAINYNPDATIDDGLCIYAISETLCELEGYSEKGDLEISDFDIKNNGEGNDDEWQFLDQLEIEVEVENTASDDIEDVEVKIVILDDRIEDGGNDVTNDFDFDDKVLDDIGRLRDDDQESVMFVIDELPSDLDSGTYYMYLMAYEDGNEENQCISKSTSLDDDYFFKFTVEAVDYEDSIVARGTELEDQLNVYCGQENLEIRVPVYNLGDDKEEKILVNLYNPELGIDEYIVINDLDNGDKESLSFFINIPSNLAQEKYDLDVIISFDWDSDEDDNDPLSYSEETSGKSIRLDILGCENEVKTPLITANLDSETEIGKNLVVKAIVTNNGESANFVFAPTGFESWANLVSISPQTATIAQGASQEITIILSPTQSGAQTFKISVAMNGEIYNQPVSVNISEEPGILSSLGISKIAFYLIVGIVILLVLIFLVLLIKLARRPAKAAF